jgi:hypothetical protein
MTLEQICAGLSAGQKDALRGIYSWSSPCDEDEGEAGLYRLGLWNPRPKYNEIAITPLGIAVRNMLEKQNAPD